MSIQLALLVIHKHIEKYKAARKKKSAKTQVHKNFMLSSRKKPKQSADFTQLLAKRRHFTEIEALLTKPCALIIYWNTTLFFNFFRVYNDDDLIHCETTTL